MSHFGHRFAAISFAHRTFPDIASATNDMPPLNILICAYVYPPDAGSGTYRTLYFANRWARSGDTIAVVTIREQDFLPDAIIDSALCRQIDPAIEVFRTGAWRPLPAMLRLRDFLRNLLSGLFRSTASSTGAVDPTPHGRSDSEPGPGKRLKDALTGALSFPDHHSGWIPRAAYRIIKVSRSRKFDCIYVTGGPWSAMLAATIAHQFTRIPLVLDFRDPWARNPNLTAHSRLQRQAHYRMERYCIRRAALIVANTEELRYDFIKRYPDIQKSTFICVSNGFESLPAPSTPVQVERFTLVHAGALYMSRNPRTFLQALINLIDSGTIPAHALHVRFVGGIDMCDAAVRKQLLKLAGVVELVSRVPHEQALALQRASHGLLLFQTGFPLQIPRKLYEYLSLSLPIVAITEPDSATAGVLRDLKAGCVTGDDPDEIATALSELYQRWCSGQQQDTNQVDLSRYSNDHLATKLRQSIGDAAHLR